ncbi:MAG TPA: DUF2075 domain-containing protein [Clostridia bacterium]|nr:DUF2075 domain-containing protein [Clostridia bacterium]
MGGTPDNPKAYVIELKQWSEAVLEPDTLEVMVPGYGLHQHPLIQVLNYRGKLRLFHSRAALYDMKAAVFLHNMALPRVAALIRYLPSDVTSAGEVFGLEEHTQLANSVRRHLLPCSLSDDEHFRFRTAPYEQTRHLFDIISRRAPEIAARASVALAEEGIGLTEEQDVLVAEVLKAVQQRDPKVFIVQGGPGSGKTLVAVTLLLRALEQKYRCVLAIRNNRLQAILRRCFDESYRGASGAMMYFEPRQGVGIGHSSFGGTFDLVVCDEAQRMESRIMPTVLARAPVSAVFLDESQRLNPPEQGTRLAFVRASREAQREPHLRTLMAAVRCRGGQLYHTWVETLLIDPTKLTEPTLAGQLWRRYYTFKVCESAEELIAELAALRDSFGGTRVAMVASFTESPGNSRNPNAQDNVRLGYPLSSGWDYYQESRLDIRWLMRPEEYVQFWLHGKSNALNRVASIYGAQGFESDYVGVIWGRDFVLRGGQWTLGDPNVCFDTIEGLVFGRKVRRWAGDALELLRNRYRIFLTRGIRGTLVFCEDSETRQCLLKMLNAPTPGVHSPPNGQTI